MTTNSPRRVELRAGLAASAATALGALALAPLFTTTTWYSTVLMMIIVVTAVGEIARWAKFPIAVAPLLEFAAVLAFLVFVYVPASAPWSFVPSAGALSALRDVLADGGRIVNTLTAPVPVSEAITALSALAIGTALVFVRALQRLGNPALAGAALVGMYLVTAFTLKSGAPWWSFALVLCGLVLLLVNHEHAQLLGWGRVLNKRAALAEDSPRTPGLSSTGLRIGGIALIVALVVPALTPTLSLPVLNFGSGNGPGSGQATGSSLATDPVTIAALVSVRRDLTDSQDRDLLEYRSEDGGPSYLRMLALESFDGTNWTPRALNAEGNQPVSSRSWPSGDETGPPPKTQTHEIRIGPLQSRYLPLPYPAVGVKVQDNWIWDQATRIAFSESATTAYLNYVAESAVVEPTIKELRAIPIAAGGAGSRSDVATNLKLGPEVPPVIGATASIVTDGLTTDYDKAVALQNYFRSRFTYDLKARSQDNSKLIEDFLRERRGYCEQFASVMALMARSVGIPARVAVGFSPGSRRSDGAWRVSTHDAHAWPELYFQDFGWIRFEPTPRAGDGSGIATPSWAPVRSATGSGSGADDPTTRPLDSSRLKKLEYEQPGGGSVGAPSTPTSEPDTTSWFDLARRAVLILFAMVAIAAVLFPSVVRWWRGRRRTRSALGPEGAWAQLRDDVRDYGRAWSDAETPRHVAARLIVSEKLGDESATSLQRLSAATERNRYAPEPAARRVSTAADRNAPTAMDDERAVRQALAQRSSWRVRWGARIFPKSVVSRRDQ